MAAIFKPKTPAPPAAPDPAPQVDQSLIDRQAQDLARKRRGVQANVYAGNTTGGTTMTPTLGGG